MDDQQHAAAALAQCARTLGLVRLRLLRLGHLADQLAAALGELAALHGRDDAATRPRDRHKNGDITAGTATSWDDALAILIVAGEQVAVPLGRLHAAFRATSSPDPPGPRRGRSAILDWRGRPLQCLDLALRLGRGTTSGRGCVVVVEGNGGPVGLRVDGVGEVLRVVASDVEPRRADDPATVLGTVRLNRRRVVLLDLDTILADRERPLP